VRKKKPDLLEPSNETLVSAPDSAPLPDETAQVHVDADKLRAVVESLDERQAAAIKLRFDYGMTSKEIQRALDVTPKRLEKIVTAAYTQLAQQLVAAHGGRRVALATAPAQLAARVRDGPCVDETAPACAARRRG